MKEPIDQLSRRQQTFTLLKDSGAAYLWPPGIVDRALDHVPGASEIGAVLSSVPFLAGVEALKNSYPFLKRLLPEGVEPLLEVLATGSQRLVTGYHAHIARQAIAQTFLSGITYWAPPLREEIDETTRFEIHRYVARYSPGQVESDGAFRAFGFQSYMEVYLVDSLANCFRGWAQKHFCTHASAPDFVIERSGAKPDVLRDSRILELLHDSIRCTELDAFQRKVLIGLTYRDLSMKELARKYATNIPKIERTATIALRRIFRSMCRQLGQNSANMLPRLARQALADLIPEESEFTALLPVLVGKDAISPPPGAAVSQDKNRSVSRER